MALQGLNEMQKMSTALNFNDLKSSSAESALNLFNTFSLAYSIVSFEITKSYFETGEMLGMSAMISMTEMAFLKP